MSFIHFNARSLKTNFHKIKDYILELNINFDIIAITETWIEPNLIMMHFISQGVPEDGVVLLYSQTRNYQVHWQKVNRL